MAAIYDSNKPLIFLDLNHLSEDLSVIGDREIHFDTTIILNELLHLVCYRDMVDQVLHNFLSSILLKSNNEYKKFDATIRLNKMRRLAQEMNVVKNISYGLRETFIKNDLYNRSGTLLVSSIDASILNACTTIKGQTKWTNGNTNISSSLTYENPLMFLEDILLSV